MKNSLKAAFVTAIAVAGITACTSVPKQNSAPVTSEIVTPTTGTSTPSVATPPVQVVTEVVTATVTAPPRAIAKVDNRLGYGGLKLGMSLEEARAAGLTDLTWDEASGHDPGCVADKTVAISKANGVERITLPADARTSQGIGVGSTFGEARRAYPSASEYRSGWSAKVADNAYYAFIGSFDLARFAEADKIQRIKLVAGVVNCSMADL